MSLPTLDVDKTHMDNGVTRYIPLASLEGIDHSACNIEPVKFAQAYMIPPYIP